METNQVQPQHYLLYLKEIALWGTGKTNTCGINAEIPILQRGLVWDQSQIELLWDSILRGIPIGSFVVCRKTNLIKNQSRHENATHYLLDGQQRCNAITLGFTPFLIEDSDKPIIWLDLDTNAQNFHASSTREFLIRITTLAHPWGYEKSDNSGKLAVGIIRENLASDEIKDDFASEAYRRPKPSEIYPFSASCPIPLSILLYSDEPDFWGNVKSNLEKFEDSKWAKKAIEFIDGDKIDKEKILSAIQCARDTKIIALNVPNYLLEPSNQERNNGDNTGITNIEHLFQRLNRQGTTLDGEELIYSMIKSYFPEIANKIDSIAKNRMPSSRLVNLSIRVALSDEKGLKGSFNVNQIRKITKADDPLDKELITHFINNNLESATSIVDKWLTNNNTSWGVPVVIKTGIAISSQEVYLLLLVLANRFPDLDENAYKRIAGISLFIHWFVDDNNKWRAVSSLYKSIADANTENLISLLNDTLRNDEIIGGYHSRLKKPEFINNLIDFNKDNLIHWSWEDCKMKYIEMSKEVEPKEELDLDREYEYFIKPLMSKITSNKEMLLYAQRNYLRKKFPDYDPARKDLWKDINRPWDFDHILPYSYIYNKKGDHISIDFCRHWNNSIGNLRAWPFEDNRSDQATKTSDKMKLEIYWEDSFISNDEKSGYSDQHVINDVQKAFDFASSCKSRLIRIYNEWFENFHINELL